MKRPWTLSFDVTSVLVFVALGRRTHDSGTSITGALEVAAPFLIGMVLGWVVMRAWERPVAIRTGYGVLASTLVVGMLLRRFVWDDGTALTFVIVALAVLTAMLLGWRVAMAVTRRSGDDDRGVSSDSSPDRG